MNDFIKNCKKHKGENSTILILDSGIPKSIDLKNKVNINKSKNFFTLPYLDKYCKNKNYLFKDKKYKYVLEDDNDNFDHQTSIMSVLSSDYLGVSPKSNIITGKILNQHGMAPLEYILEGLIFANQINPNVVNISNGYSLSQIKKSSDYRTHDRINEEIIKLHQKNIMVVCAKKNWDTGFYPADFNETLSILEFNSEKDNIADLVYDQLSFLVDTKKNSFNIKKGSSLMTGFVSGIVSNYISYLKHNNKEIDIIEIKKELIKNKKNLKILYPASIQLTTISENKINDIISNITNS